MSNLASTFRSTLAGRRSSVLAIRAALFVAICFAEAHALAKSSDGEERSFVLRAARIVTADAEIPWSFEPGIIIVRDGRIEAIGADIPLPPDLPVFDFPDATILPGFVVAATSIAPVHSGDESIAAGFLAIDSFQAHSDFRRELAGGVTTVHLSPGDHRLVSGQGAVVKLGGRSDSRVLVPQADLTINLVERAFRPPPNITYQTPASSDVAIPPAVRQRPDSRMGQYLAIEEALALEQSAPPLSYRGLHGQALTKAWRQNLPLRVGADRAVDLLGAIAFLRRHEHFGYLVGGREAGQVADQIKQANVPLVYLLDGLRKSSPDIETDPDTLETDAGALRKLEGVKLALAPAAEGPLADFRLVAAATAQRAGLSQKRTIDAMTRVPAEVLGVAHRVGSLSPGKDADIVVWFGDPLRSSAHVHRVYVNGSLSFEAPSSSALIVRAGTIWVNKEERIHNGAVLIEDGRITATGHSVPHPPFARVIDAGSDAFVTPGLIDAHGHLGLEGDKDPLAPALSLAMAIGADDVTDRRVARAGVTAVVLSPYKASGQGSQVSVIKTAGATRDERVAKATAGVYFDMAAKDALKVESTLRKRWKTGKKYLEKWQKFEKELAEWKEKKAKGEKIDDAAETEESNEAIGKVDPVTGTWAV
ncbi:MAG: amidohydrolase family protein, partial [Planctomycetes bacterium]|nr:amidohydrolase family protein [Planctomycetota bacterium]